MDLLLWLFLSLTAQPLHAGDTFTVTASIYASTPISSTATLEAPGLEVLSGPQPFYAEDGTPATLAWLVAVPVDAPPGLRMLILRAGGRVITRQVYVCCETWPPAVTIRRLFLPMAQK